MSAFALKLYLENIFGEVLSTAGNSEDDGVEFDEDRAQAIVHLSQPITGES